MAQEISEEFKRAFMMVTAHYGCSQAEQNLMKGLAKAKYHDAEPCFLVMAREINPAFGINDRIKNSIRAEGLGGSQEILDNSGITAYERAVEQLVALRSKNGRKRK
jgi:hypothetical protein